MSGDPETVIQLEEGGGDDWIDCAAVIERLFVAINRQDAEGVASCMALDYCGEQPLHPERRAHDREQMRRNWRTVFLGTPGLTLR